MTLSLATLARIVGPMRVIYSDDFLARERAPADQKVQPVLAVVEETQRALNVAFGGSNGSGSASEARAMNISIGTRVFHVETELELREFMVWWAATRVTRTFIPKESRSW